MAEYNQRITASSHSALTGRYSGTQSQVSSSYQTSAASGIRVQGIHFSAGQVIRGEVVDLRNHEIRIQLSNNQYISGRIDNAVRLSIGEQATFQVSRLDNETIALKLVSDPVTSSQESTIDKALDAAGLPRSERNVSAVRALLSQDLSVDKGSIQNLMRQSAAFRNVSFDTLAILQKNHLPFTETTARQLDAYLNYEHRIAQLTTQASAELSSFIYDTAQTDGLAASAINRILLSVMTEGLRENTSSADLPLSDLSLLSSDGLVSLLDTLESLQLPAKQLAEIANGSLSLRDTVHILRELSEQITGASSAKSSTAADTPAGPEQPVGQTIAMPSQTAVEPPVGQTIAMPSQTTIEPPAEQTIATPSQTTIEQPAEQTITAPAQTTVENIASEKAITENTAMSLFRSLIQGAGSFFSPHANDLTTPPPSAGFSPNPAEQTILFSDFPTAMQIPEVYSLLQAYSDLTVRAQELSTLLTKSQRTELAGLLKGKLPSTVIKKLEDGELSANELMRLLLQAETSQSNNDSSFLRSSAYQELLQQWLEARFTMHTEDLSDKKNVADFYKSLDQKLAALEKISARTGEVHSFQDTAASIRDNIDFMKTLNQSFPYIQLPVHLSDRTLHAELYVYTNQQTAASQSDAAHVLLHLDLEQLGSTDIHLTLQGTTVRAHFYLPNSSGAAITQENLPLLQRTLAAKGYSFVSKTDIRDSKTNPVHDFFLPPENYSSMKRYTFDIRA